jgi:hypothetical protein
MTGLRLKSTYIIIGTAILFTSCGLPKELLQVVDSRPKEMVELPIDYCNIFPTTTFEQWDKDYNSFDRYLFNTGHNANTNGTFLYH